MGRTHFLIVICLLGCQPNDSTSPISKTLSVPQTARATYFTSDGELITINTSDTELLDTIRYVVLNTNTPAGWVYLFDRLSNIVSFVPKDRWLALSYQHRSARWSGFVVAERARVMLERRQDSDNAASQKRKRDAIGDGVVDIIAVDFDKRVRSIVWNQPTAPHTRYAQPCVSVCSACDVGLDHRRLDPLSTEAGSLRQYLGFSSQDFTVCGMTAKTIVSRETKRVD